MVRKHIEIAERDGFLNLPFPEHLKRRILPRRNLRDAQVQTVMELFAHYGISDNKHKWALLSLALMSGLTRAFEHMARSPGRPRVIFRPDLLYATITAIQSRASEEHCPLDLPENLQRLVRAIGADSHIQTLHRDRRVKTIVERLKATPASPWCGIKDQTIRYAYNTQKKLAGASKKDFDALS